MLATRPGEKCGLVVGAALVLAGLLVSSATWLAVLRDTIPPELERDLTWGAAIFRAGVVALGALILAGSWSGWWRSDEARRADNRLAVSWSLVAILLAALPLRLYHLGDGLWLDEILTLVKYVRLPLGELVTTFRSQNQHLLYSILAHASIAGFGESTWALRLPAALFGVGSIWALFFFASQVVQRREALLSAVLLCVSYHHLWFSQNARGYTGVLFFTLLSSALLLRGLAGGSRRTWLAYAVGVALGVYTHLTMIFVVVAQFGVFAVRLVRGTGEPASERWLPLASGFGFAGLLAVTLYGIVIPQFFSSALHGSQAGITTWRDPLWALQEALRAFELGLGPGAAVGAAGVAVLGLGSASFLRQRPAVVALLYLPALLAAGVALAIGHHLWPRTFFMLAGFGVLVLIRGGMMCGEILARLARLSEPAGARIGVAGTLLVALVSAATLPLAYGPKQDFVAARDFVERERREGDSVVTVGIAIFPYQHLYAPHWRSADDAEALQQIRDESRQTWVVSIFPPYMRARHPDILALLEAGFTLAGRFEGSLGGGSVDVYRSDEPGGAGSQSAAPLSAAKASGVSAEASPSTAR